MQRFSITTKSGSQYEIRGEPGDWKIIMPGKGEYTVGFISSPERGETILTENLRSYKDFKRYYIVTFGTPKGIGRTSPIIDVKPL